MNEQPNVLQFARPLTRESVEAVRETQRHYQAELNRLSAEARAWHKRADRLMSERGLIRRRYERMRRIVRHRMLKSLMGEPGFVLTLGIVLGALAASVL